MGELFERFKDAEPEMRDRPARAAEPARAAGWYPWLEKAKLHPLEMQLSTSVRTRCLISSRYLADDDICPSRHVFAHMHVC